MNLTILAAAGRTGRELVRQALARGHTVLAVARDPARIAVPESASLRKAAADVQEPGAIAEVVDGDSVVLSALGTDRAGVLAAGAKAVIAAGPARIIWLGAYGTGGSAGAAGEQADMIMKMMGDRVADKVAADTAVLDAGGTVFHAGRLGDGPAAPQRRTVGLDLAPPLDLAVQVSRATVAAAMLDEAERPRFPRLIAVPLSF